MNPFPVSTPHVDSSAAPAAPDAAHPYEQLTPDVVLDALASVGLWGDGRLTALSSYENRVYQTKRVIWVFRSNVTGHSGLS